MFKNLLVVIEEDSIQYGVHKVEDLEFIRWINIGTVRWADNKELIGKRIKYELTADSISFTIGVRMSVIKEDNIIND